MTPWKYGPAELRLLSQLHDKLSGQFQLAEPFVPYVGAAYASSPVRIMVLGKATEGSWRCEADWGYSYEEHAERFVQESVATGEYHSAFWRFIMDLVREVHRAAGAVGDDGSPQWALNRVAWSNVFKLGQSKRGPPSRELAAAQLPLMRELIAKELAKWKPTAVVATVGDSYGDHVRALFEETGWEENVDPVAGKDLWVMTIQPGMRLYWTRHPQGARRGVLEAIRGYIAKDQVGLRRQGAARR